ncbi:MAG: disulfide bond formation protein B [Candidatus Woesearchaeota archaeon]
MKLLYLLSIMTLFSHLALITLLFIYILKKEFFKNFLKIFYKYSLFFAFLVSLVSTIGSLSFSEILKLEPCRLCWFQRIFMYPLVILLGLPLFIKKFRKDFFVLKKYIILLALIGSLFSIYHHTLQIFGSFFNQNYICDVNGISCSTAYFQFGYITIPLMALTSFIMIIFIISVNKRNFKKI